MSKTKGIGEQLRAAIATAERRGLTRGGIADKAKMPRSQLTRVATGESEPLVGTAERIARALGYRLALLPIAT